MVFDNRFMYSAHCGSTEHKENVFGHNKPVQSYARGGKAKSIFMMARSKPVQYESDTTEDYENENDEQKQTVERTDDQMEKEHPEGTENETEEAAESEETVVENEQTVVEEEEKKNDTTEASEETQVQGLVARKTVFGVCNKVRLKPACSATEIS